MRLPFAFLLVLAGLAAIVAGGWPLLAPLIYVFAKAWLRGAHRERVW